MKKNILFASFMMVGLLSSCTFTFVTSNSGSGDSVSENPSNSQSDGDASSSSGESSSSATSASSLPESSSTEASSSQAPASSSSSAASSSAAAGESDYVPAGYALKWSDEFVGSSLNDSSWTHQTGNGSDYGIWGWGNNEQENYQAANTSVSNGTLHITAKRETTTIGSTTYNYTSSRIRSYGKVSTTYGYVVAKMKLPAVQGMWPAFWMLPENAYQTKGWPTSGEIDIMENRGREAYQVGGTTHSADASGGDSYHTGSYGLASSIDNWHVYAVEWTSETIQFSADGHVYNTVDRATWVNGNSAYGEGPAPFNAPFHIIFNLAVGGNYDGGKLPPDNFASAAMDVDYVRIYQK
jgi:beta-glucanase (GH16 family)